MLFGFFSQRTYVKASLLQLYTFDMIRLSPLADGGDNYDITIVKELIFTAFHKARHAHAIKKKKLAQEPRYTQKIAHSRNMNDLDALYCSRKIIGKSSTNAL